MTNQKSLEKYRFIPYRKHDLVEMCLQEGNHSGQEEDFRHLYYMLSSIFHFEFHKVIESLKDTYAATDPDTDTISFNNKQPLTNLDFVELLGGLLEKANYERISKEALNQALDKASLFQINLHVDFSDYSEVLLFCRGVSERSETISSLFGLRKKTIHFTNFDRVVVYTRFRDDYVPSDDTDILCKPGITQLKLFKNVPKADLEMLFPNTAVRMRLFDKLLIGVPALISGGIMLTTKLGASLVILGSLFGFWLGLSAEPVELNKTSLLVIIAGLATLGGYLWKQFSKFKNRKLLFMQTLTQNLYFKNLDNNAGVFHRLANDAEEEECKEALLAYYFFQISEQAKTRVELDRAVELWFAEKWGCEIDFEIDDALNKLLKLNLIEETNGRYTTISVTDAISVLDKRWDDYFIVKR